MEAHKAALCISTSYRHLHESGHLALYSTTSLCDRSRTEEPQTHAVLVRNLFVLVIMIQRAVISLHLKCTKFDIASILGQHICYCIFQSQRCHSVPYNRSQNHREGDIDLKLFKSEYKWIFYMSTLYPEGFNEKLSITVLFLFNIIYLLYLC